MRVNLEWQYFKLELDKGIPYKYLEINNNYVIYALDGVFEIACMIPPENSADYTDFEDNYKDYAKSTLAQFDTDGANIVRIKAAKKGWTYNGIGVEFKTSELNSLICKDRDGNSRSWVTIKFYNNSDEEVTTEGLLEANEATIVKTVVDFEPPYDYEVVGGTLRTEQDISSPQDCRMWIVAAPDISEVYGGSKEMVSNLNLRFLAAQNAMAVDGRVTKYLTYNESLHSNKLRFIFKHNAGLKMWIHFIVDMYRA